MPAFVHCCVETTHSRGASATRGPNHDVFPHGLARLKPLIEPFAQDGKLGALLLLMVSLAIAALEPSPLGSQLASV